MAASYPSAAKSFVSRVAGDTIQPAHVNDIQDETTAVETDLLTAGLTSAGIAWADVAYNAANFAANGGGTWTVASGDQIEYTYQRPGGKVLRLHGIFDATSVAGTVSSITVAIPGGFIAARQCWGSGVIFDNSTTVASLAKVRCLAAAATVVTIGLASAANLTASADQTYVRFQIEIETTT